MQKPTIGFIGQGWIGKHYADDFERRGFSVVRYSREAEHHGNMKVIAKCDIVFIADHVGDALGVKVLRAIEKKNIALLKQSKKDLDLLRGVYGDFL